MIITKIEVQKKNKQRASLFLDDEFYCGLSCETVVKNRLKEGLEVSLEFINCLKNETERDVALSKTVNFISKSQKTIKQINDYLVKKGFDQDIIDYVLNKLAEYNFVDDEQFAKNFVKYKTKSNGKRKVFMELKQKGVADEIAKQSIDDYSKDEESIYLVAEKYLKLKPRDLKTKQKAFRFLASKGYETENIIKCLNSFFKEDEINNESWN